MKKEKRKPRKDIAKKADLTIPFDISKLGTMDDPCFGKLYKPSTPECTRCGDNEICAIAMMQKNTLKRAKIESNGKFKDLEEAKIESRVTPEEIKKQVKARIRELVKLSGKDGITIDKAINDVNAIYFRDGYTKERLKKIIGIMVEKSNNILETKNVLKWKA